MKKFITLLGAVVLSVSLLVGCGASSGSSATASESSGSSATASAGSTAAKENKEEKVLGIIGAMEEEVEILKGKMDIKDTVEVAGMTFYSGKLHDKNVVLVRSGVGKVNMASCTQILADQFHVTALLNSGVAGTMDPELNQGDIVISTDAVQHDFDTTVFGDPLGEISRLGITFFEADKNLIDIAKKAAQNIDGLVIKEGRIASGDQFVAGGAVAERIKENFGNVSAVEMEGAAMAQTAYLNKIPYVVLRAISDKADGSADLSYEEFLPIAAKNVSAMVEEFVKLY